MREIKFRYWTGSQMLNNIGVHPFISTRHENEDGSLMDNSKEGCLTVFSYNEGLMQYTGLKDKNGKDIYEGDKLRDSRIDVDNIYEVSWSEQCGGFVIDLEDEQLYNILEYVEVIGNIYENPELLNKKE